MLLINTAVCASGPCCCFIVESLILNENFTKLAYFVENMSATWVLFFEIFVIFFVSSFFFFFCDEALVRFILC